MMTINYVENSSEECEAEYSLPDSHSILSFLAFVSQHGRALCVSPRPESDDVHDEGQGEMGNTENGIHARDHRAGKGDRGGSGWPFVPLKQI